MSYLNLPLLHIFHLVAERGSFQAVANELSLPRSSISKKIRQLEDFVGQPLIKRSTRQLHLTEVGLNLLAGTDDLTRILSNMHDVIEETQAIPKGKVKISASMLMGQRFLIPLLSKFRKRYPEIALEISFKDENVDFLTEKVDIAIRIGCLPDSSLIARQIGTKQWGWFASERYLLERGYPKYPHELKQYDCLAFGNITNTFNCWPFQDKYGHTETIEVTPAIKTDNSRALVDMACEGLGIIMIDPAFISEEIKIGKLTPVLPEWGHPDTSPINLVCLGQRTKAAQVVWQFLLEHF
ncbi:LysR family transcriptional regulator [Endozoicomonas sp. SM1973]|uniref:LysR family transcriptional regulator n=1 Tax=Spartinivicinus marinus TaxID=2994442 RepID=A0A853I998_9GAMM|nr:LysR substrate-binding domain-containing protein [Spartinivicinus marinus]NYZ65835.1 LysR family transcriptional regulator [Spartinivicinus marinus]